LTFSAEAPLPRQRNRIRARPEGQTPKEVPSWRCQTLMPPAIEWELGISARQTCNKTSFYNILGRGGQ